MAYTIDHEDIWLESSDAFTWQQSFDDTLNYENLAINQESYMDYQPTRLQFLLNFTGENQTIQIKLKHINRLNPTHLKYAAVCQYNSETKEWAIIPHTLNKKTLDFTITQSGVFGVFINHYWYSSFTQRMADEYPFWTKIRNNKESNGQLFLNYFGIELEVVYDYLLWIKDQKYIQTVDVTVLDWVYMYQLPDIMLNDTLQFMQGDKEIPVLETLQEFFYNERNQGGIVDYQDKRFYTTKAYGPLKLNITRDDVTTAHDVTPMDYHIWGALDEFGLMLGVERLHLEKNEEYRERILDVFRYPAGTHDIGLTNGIARELQLIKRITWENDQKEFYLKNTSGKFIEPRSIKVDDVSLEEGAFTIDEAGSLSISARNEGTSHVVSFIVGVQKHQLYNKADEKLYKMIYQDDGQATSKMMTWVEYINTFAPVMWDRFNWDEGFWDTISQDLTGLGYVPNIWDSNIEVWKNYVFDSDR